MVLCHQNDHVIPCSEWSKKRETQKLYVTGTSQQVPPNGYGEKWNGQVLKIHKGKEKTKTEIGRLCEEGFGRIGMGVENEIYGREETATKHDQ